MTDNLLVAVAILLVVLVAIQLVTLRRRIVVDTSPVQQALDALAKSHERIERSVREEIAKNREETSASGRHSREELATALKDVGDAQNKQAAASLKFFNESLLGFLASMADAQQKRMDGVATQLGKLTESNEQKLDTLKTTVEQKLKAIQDDNTKQIDLMRATVDEKLQGTLEKRLGESFKQVSDRLEQVYRGLGEMQTLATGVGDLKKMLTNVKTRGTWGEVQLGAMLEQVLSPDQYESNVAPKEGGERVEFGIKMPGRGDDHDDVVWLPIDAKFPVEDYQRLVEAQDNADAMAAEDAASHLEARIKQCAKDICEKYVNPPRTTDFAILFLPTEGLFAEVLRRPGLPEFVQRQCRVVIAGPTTLWSILSSLQMGFRTLAIQKRSSEVWNLLAAVKTEWTRYGEVLAKVQKKLNEASNTVEDAAKRTRAIGRKLREVQELPVPEAVAVLELEAAHADGDTGEA
ncbi:MAG: DNA recombination protein RmuC [Polyangiaceae bacterium]